MSELIKKLLELDYDKRVSYIKEYFKALHKAIEGKSDDEVKSIIKSLCQSGKDVEVLTLFIVALTPKELQDDLLPLLPVLTSLLTLQGVKAGMSVLNSYGIDAKKLQKIAMFIKKL